MDHHLKVICLRLRFAFADSHRVEKLRFPNNDRLYDPAVFRQWESLMLFGRQIFSIVPLRILMSFGSPLKMFFLWGLLRSLATFWEGVVSPSWLRKRRIEERKVLKTLLIPCFHAVRNAGKFSVVRAGTKTKLLFYWSVKKKLFT